MTRKEIVLEILDWVKYLALAVIVGLLITIFVIQRNDVVGNSMFPTLHNGDMVVVEKVSRLWGGLDRGDIITVHGEKVPGSEGTLKEDVVKRIVGCPGDHIQIKDGHVFVNGEQLKEDYLPEGTLTEPLDPKYSDVTLGPDEYYVLGDNRGGSRDSRDFGPVPKDSIIGHVWFRFYPLRDFGAPK